MLPLVIHARPHWRFPFLADYISVHEGETVIQRIQVLERFKRLYRVRGLKPLRVPGLTKPVPAGVSYPVEIETVHEKRRGPNV